MQTLPPELLSTIFANLPLVALGRCRRVCRKWLVLIDTDSFVIGRRCTELHVAFASKKMPRCKVFYSIRTSKHQTMQRFVFPTYGDRPYVMRIHE